MEKLQKLKLLHTLLGSDNLILTGSTALAFHGLVSHSEAKDIDIILVNASPTAIDVLNKLQKAEPSAKFKDGGPVNYSFIFQGVKVDVWLLKQHDESDFIYTKDGVRIASIQSIVAAKKAIGRSRDWIQLMQLSKKIFNPAEFNEILPSLTSNENYNEQ